METLSIDLETYSSVDLGKSGVYKYAESPDFEILLFGYSVDRGSVQVIDLTDNNAGIPAEILQALADSRVQKWAFNANFERVCLSRYLGMPVGEYLDPASWHCTMIWSAYMGLPLSLKGVGSVLGLDRQKLEEGKDLIKYFCMPCSPTLKNGGRTRNLPADAPDKWELFKTYNRRDVETELDIQQRLSKHPVPDSVWDEYHLDQEINDRGVLLDMPLVEAAIEMDGRSRKELMEAMCRITELENPNSVVQMRSWLADNGLQTDTLGKKAVSKMMKTVPPYLQEVLTLRQQLAKSSVKKYQAMQNAVCSDGRARGMFQFYGANRTGRWAGRLIQAQNLSQNHIPDLNEARALVRCSDYEAVKMLYEDVPDTLSQLVRTAFIPRDGTKFYVADFSAIEARVIAWYAGETWRQQVFAEGKDIYCQSASSMFKVPVEKHGINGHLRQKGKIAELACIAEGSPVLTDHGLVPIEAVTADMKVWDGENWVRHEGVIYRGKREVITYEGLTATPDHLVWIEGKQKPVQLGVAAARGSHLLQTGDGGRAIRLGETSLCSNSVSGLQKTKKLETDKCTARLYDIRNAGKHHRFTVSGKLVHNCGYGGSVGALKAMGALEMGLQEEELKPLVDAWRSANPNIVRFWWDVDRAVLNAVRNKSIEETHGIRFSCASGMLSIQLPSGRKLNYVKPRISENRFGGECITYEGVGGTKKWERLESYGPKFVENIVQATARDILCYAMKTLRSCSVVMHIHDELVIEADPRVSLDAICEQMGRTPPWAKGLLLRADGYITEFYKKD